MNVLLPQARKDSLIIKEVNDETLVYDLNNDKAHCLNLTAAVVWKNCDGKNTVGDLHKLMEKNAGSPVPEEVVWLALDQLQQFQLLTTPIKQPNHLSSLSRRQMIRLVGTAAIAAPVIFSIVAPRSAEAQSLLPAGACCNSPGQCLSNNCTQNPVCADTPSTKACA
jgi:hypothetical protein